MSLILFNIVRGLKYLKKHINAYWFVVFFSSLIIYRWRARYEGSCFVCIKKENCKVFK